jgi:hypothetical protein
MLQVSVDWIILFNLNMDIVNVSVFIECMINIRVSYSIDYRLVAGEVGNLYFIF